MYREIQKIKLVLCYIMKVNGGRQHASIPPPKDPRLVRSSDSEPQFSNSGVASVQTDHCRVKSLCARSKFKMDQRTTMVFRFKLGESTKETREFYEEYWQRITYDNRPYTAFLVQLFLTISEVVSLNHPTSIFWFLTSKMFLIFVVNY